MTGKGKLRAAAAAAGAVNGLFGGGGGMVLLPFLAKKAGLPPRSAFATCLAIIYPVCCVSAVVYLFRVRPDAEVLLPCLLGGCLGGGAAGLTFERVSVRVLKAVFGLFLIWGGVRYLL